MKLRHVVVMCIVLVCLFSGFCMPGPGINAKSADDDYAGCVADTAVRDTIWMKADTVVTCILQPRVLLTCSNEYMHEDILEYKWIDLSTNKVIGNTRNIWVETRYTKEYALEIQILDRKRELITNPDFERGNNGFQTAYRYVWPGYNALWDEGVYTVSTNPRGSHMNFDRIGDHTSGKGQMMIINGNTGKNVKVWGQTISGLTPGQQYAFSAWAISVTDGAQPILQYTINGLPLSTSENDNCKPPRYTWVRFHKYWTAGSSKTANISLVDQCTVAGGNDFAIDDISFAPISLITGKVLVKVRPQINLDALKDVEVCEGADLQIESHATGSEISAYKWLRLSDNKVVSQTDKYSLNNASLSQDQGQYLCVVQGICGADSAFFTVDVREKLRVNGPEVDTVEVCNGSPAQLTAERCSGYNLSYVWRSPAMNWLFPGWGWLPATADTKKYDKPSVVDGDAGKYRCVVRSTSKGGLSCGTDTIYSVLKVKNSPVLLRKTSDTTICAGGRVHLYVVTNDSKAVTTWYLPDGSSVTGGDIVVNGGNSAALYKYEVNNGCIPIGGSVYVGIFEPMGNLAISRDTTVCRGGTVTLKGKVSGKNLKYRWTGPDGFLATTPQVSIVNFSETKEGVYHLVVSDTCGDVREGDIRVTVNRDYDNLTINDDKVYCRGEAVDTLQVKGGVGSMKYTWMCPDGSVVRKQKLVIPVINNNAGVYVCKVDGACGAVEKSTEISMYDPLTVSGNTGKIRLCAGESTRLQAMANLPVVRYEWRKDGQLLSETGAELVLNRVQTAEAGRYKCTVVSVCESADLDYEIELKETTQITDYTPDTYVNEYGSVLLFVNAKGENNKFSWTENGVSTGTSGNKLYINNVGLTGTRTFICKVKGDCGEAERVIKVYIGKYNTLTADRAERLCEGGDYSYNVGLVPTGCNSGSVLTYRWEFGGKVVKNASLLDLKNLKPSDGGRYTCYISGSCGQAVLNLDVTVVRLPKLSELPDTLSVCEGSETIMLARANSNDLLTFAWQKGSLTVGGTDSIFRIKQTKMQDAGNYSCRVSGQCGEDNGNFVLKVRKKLEILQSQDTVGVCDGQEVELKVVAVGDRLEYTWDGPNKSGWTGGNTDVFKNKGIKREKDGGKYWCIVNSTCGRDTVYTVVNVEKEMKLLAQSPDMVVCPDSKVTLYARVNLENVKYLWTLPDGTTNNANELVVNKMSGSDTGVYRFQVKGKCADINGVIALEFYPSLGELSYSPDTAVCEHGSVHLKAFAEGESVKYQWRGPGRFSAESASVTIPDVVSALTGKYNVVATDVCNRQKQANVNVTILDEFRGVKVVGDTVLCPGAEFVAKVETENDRLSYEWIFKGNVIGREARFSIPAVSPVDTGTYECRIAGTCTTQTYPVKLGIYKSLVLKEAIQKVRVCPGVDTSFMLQARGEKVAYRWTKKGVEVGTRDSILPFYEVSVLDTGAYVCHVASVCGEAEREFQLQLKPRTVVRSHTPDRFVTEDDPALLTVRADGENNKYHWWQDGVKVGEDSMMLYIPNVGKADTLHFICAVQGDCGIDTAMIMVKIGVFKSIQEVVSPDTLCEGSTYTYVADYVPEHCYGDEPFTYTWSFNGNKIGEGPLLRLEDVTLAEAGEYSCLIESYCDRATVTWKVHVTSLPVIEWMTDDAFIIEGGEHEIEVKAKGEGLGYSWSKDGQYYTKNKTKISFEPVRYEDQGIYRVEVANICSSVSRESELKVWRKTTIITPLPTDVAMCQGQDSVFKVAALGATGLLYKWYHNGEPLSCPMVPELRLEKVGDEDAGTYMCVVNGKGGNDTCYMNLTIKGLPQVDIEGLTDMCMNDLRQVYQVSTEEQSLVYSWEAVGGNLPAGNHYYSTVEIVWQGDEESKVILQATSSQTGCSRQVEKEIHYKKLPEVYLDLPEMVGYCLDSLVLNQGYPWGGQYWVDDILASTVIFEYKEKDYGVTYTYEETETGCSNSEYQSIGVDEEPVIQLRDERVETGVCHPVVLAVERASAGNILWTGQGDLDTADVMNPVYAPKAEDGESVYFSVELTDQYDCKASDYVTVSIIALPVVKAMDDVKAGVCGETILTAEYNTPRFAGLEWLPAEELDKGDNYSAIVKEKIAGRHVYEAVVTDVYGCRGKDSVILTVMPSPPVDDEEFCENQPFRVDCQGYLNYVWNDGYIESVRVLDKQGDYSLVITDEFGCVGTVYYAVHPMPVVDIRDTVLYEGQNTTFIVRPEERYAPYDIVWQDNSAGYSYYVDSEGHYEVTVADNIGCTSQDTAFVEVKKRYIAAPDAFLPNSSSENSRFYLKEVNFGSRFEMYIYDRWGELLFKTSKIGFNGGWNGSFKGVQCQPGAYVWVAFVDGKEVGKGTLVLVK